MDATAFQEAVLTLRSANCRDLLGEAEGQDPYDAAPTASPSSAAAAAADASAPAARCRPWSEADYFRRLRSFTPQTWFGKSLAAAPPRCAAHGWVNAGLDRLRCEGCHTTLTIESGLDEEAVPDVSSPAHHTEVCPWAGQACPPDVIQFPLATPEALLARMGRRARGCRHLLGHYRGQLGVVTPHDAAEFLAPIRLPLAAVARQLRQAGRGGEDQDQVQEAEAAAPEPDAMDVGAALLALHGWEATAASRSAGADAGAGAGAGAGAPDWALGCRLCGRKIEVARLLARRVSLSLTSRKEGGGDPSPTRRRSRGVQGQGQGQGQGEEEIVDFDPVEQHRYYCPWASSGLDGGAGEEGWRQALKVVASRTPRAWFASGGGGGGKKRERGDEEDEEEEEEDVMPEWLAAGRSPVGGGGSGGGGCGGENQPGGKKPPQKPEDVYRTAISLLRSF